MYIKELRLGNQKIIGVRASESARWSVGIYVTDSGEVSFEWNRPTSMWVENLLGNTDQQSIVGIDEAKDFLKALEKAIEIAEGLP